MVPALQMGGCRGHPNHRAYVVNADWHHGAPNAEQANHQKPPRVRFAPLIRCSLPEESWTPPESQRRTDERIRSANFSDVTLFRSQRRELFGWTMSLLAVGLDPGQ